MRIAVQIIAYLWASPYTITGIAIGLILNGRFQRVDGVIEIHGPRIAWLLRHMIVCAQALTLGHVVFGQNESALDFTRRHERVHVRQYERWGPMFVPLYLLFSAILFLRGRDGYRDNPFEIEAYEAEEAE
ncbi:signal peptide prediction [Rhodopirellula maiorica SM1]|uniref:Signal peptide prediction n=1 Tax=Rhodopirellula maiorica SM1 TaxID=1265738 RepID=M5S9Q5_9BACT|nr:hypothetical protein [Rhodopirellula maiorica]EMI22909.1 signal peptide prediction [Rhodopirellula maiorica SM1]